MNLPTATEINPTPENLDGQCAQRHFLGKTLEEAEALFLAASLTYQEDLMFMGVSAFRFYVQAAISYIRSDSATTDSDFINCFAGILESRLENEAAELHPIASQLADICGYIVKRYDKFDLTPEIYGNLRFRYQALSQTFLHQLETRG